MFIGRKKELEEDSTLSGYNTDVYGFMEAIKDKKLEKFLEDQKKEFEVAKELTLEKFPNAQIEIEIKDDYRNMKEVLDKDPRAVDKIIETFKKLNIE